MADITAEALDFVARQAEGASQPKKLGDALVIVHAGQVVDRGVVESGDPTPSRPRGVVHTTTPDALVEYVRPHIVPTCRLYVTPDRMALAVVLNDDCADFAGWRDWVAHMTLTPTPGWVRWTAANRKLLDQTAFAELIEDGLAEIVDPDGADLLELAQTFQATSSAAFRGGQRLQSGAVSFTYTEDVSAVGGSQGTISIPDRITLNLVPFYGADPRRITARFRFRLNGGKLALGFIIDGLEELLRAVMDEVADEVGAQTGLTPICVTSIPPATVPRH